MAVPTNDHYLPLFYTEGVREAGDELVWIHQGMQNGSIAMRSYSLR